MPALYRAIARSPVRVMTSTLRWNQVLGASSCTNVRLLNSKIQLSFHFLGSRNEVFLHDSHNAAVIWTTELHRCCAMLCCTNASMPAMRTLASLQHIIEAQGLRR